MDNRREIIFTFESRSLKIVMNCKRFYFYQALCVTEINSMFSFKKEIHTFSFLISIRSFKNDNPTETT